MITHRSKGNRPLCGTFSNRILTFVNGEPSCGRCQALLRPKGSQKIGPFVSRKGVPGIATTIREAAKILEPDADDLADQDHFPIPTAAVRAKAVALAHRILRFPRARRYVPRFGAAGNGGVALHWRVADYKELLLTITPDGTMAHFSGMCGTSKIDGSEPLTGSFDHVAAWLRLCLFAGTSLNGSTSLASEVPPSSEVRPFSEVERVAPALLCPQCSMSIPRTGQIPYGLCNFADCCGGTNGHMDGCTGQARTFCPACGTRWPTV